MSPELIRFCRAVFPGFRNALALAAIAERSAPAPVPSDRVACRMTLTAIDRVRRGAQPFAS